MDNKYIIKEAYGVLPPNAMTINEMLYYMCAYIKEHAVKGDTGPQGEPGPQGETGPQGVSVSNITLTEVE